MRDGDAGQDARMRRMRDRRMRDELRGQAE
jgi:hypothetical protein